MNEEYQYRLALDSNGLVHFFDELEKQRRRDDRMNTTRRYSRKRASPDGGGRGKGKYGDGKHE
jgi:hypothetical protein